MSGEVACELIGVFRQPIKRTGVDGMSPAGYGSPQERLDSTEDRKSDPRLRGHVFYKISLILDSSNKNIPILSRRLPPKG